MSMVFPHKEPFYGGSHKQLIDEITSNYLNGKKNLPFQLHTLPSKKWHWRARTSALYFAQTIDSELSTDDVLFCSSVLNLAEFVALRKDVAKCRKKIIYFHENQLVYPVKKIKGERDFQYGYNQIISALVADEVIFNSNFNCQSFLDSIGSFLKLQPDHRADPKLVRNQISVKSKVLYFPVAFPILNPSETEIQAKTSCCRTKPLHIVWPHRWEYDKDPDTFFEVLFELKNEKEAFRVSILGQSFQDPPAIFEEAKIKLCDELLHFGSIDNRSEYLDVLSEADVVVSTALHEFFGVAMIEASVHGCYPLLPERLVYPEIYPSANLYRTPAQLKKKLKTFCRKPIMARQLWTREMACQNFKKFHPDSLREKYLELLQ